MRSLHLLVILPALLGMPAGAAAQEAPAQQSYAPIVDRVAPAVVTVHAQRRVRTSTQYPFMDDPFLRDFFGNGNGNAPPRRRQQQPNNDRGMLQRGLGSGVIVSADGYILTNHHVVDGADQISVELNDLRTFEAKLIGSDQPSDLAVLKIAATRLPVLPLGDSDKVRVGDICLAVGNPLGIGETVTAGIISAKGRSTGLSDGSFEDFLQTDAAINQGNSGGALVNMRGEVIGINSQILSPSGGNIGIGFSIPSNMAKSVMEQLRSGGKVRRGMLGVGIQPITPELAAGMKLPTTRGVLINSVEPGGAAEKAGVKPGDVIVGINGATVEDPNALRNKVASTLPGSDVKLAISREGKPVEVTAQLGELPGDGTRARSDQPETRRSAGSGQLGVRVEALTPETASDLGLRRGIKGAVVIDVDPDGPAAEAGIRRDDVILEVNQQPVTNATEIREAMQKTGSGPALLLVSRGGRNLFLAVKPNGQ